MKIITLNIWGGNAGKDKVLPDEVSDHSPLFIEIE